MTSHAVAAESLVFTPVGPCAAGSLQEGAEVLGIDREGRIKPFTLAAARRPAGGARLKRVLTMAGEAMLPAEAAVGCAAGSIVVDRLTEEGVRVELIVPADLPSLSETLCSPLAGLLPGRFLIPTENGVAGIVSGEITAGAQRLGLAIEQQEQGRWLVVRMGEAPVDPPAWTWGDERRLVGALCGWGITEEKLICSRTRLSQPLLRRRLMGAYTACNESFSVSWLPGFLPIECRLSPSEQLPAFAPVQHVLEDSGPIALLDTAEQSALIVGPLIVRGEG